MPSFSIISSSDGTYLRFEKGGAEAAAYRAAEEDLYMQAYGRQRAKYGIWASNQDKFVKSVDDLNQHDRRRMEQRYADYLAKPTLKLFLLLAKDADENNRDLLVYAFSTEEAEVLWYEYWDEENLEVSTICEVPARTEPGVVGWDILLPD